MTEKNFKIESAAVSDKGLSKKRPQNEDSFLELSARGLFAVADGVGGAQAGEVASKMAVEILAEAFADLSAGGDAEDLMKVAVERANRAIYQKSHDLTELSTMATTFVGLHVAAGNIATIGHVGDSRLYRLDARGNLSRETQDHSIVEEEVRAGRMTAAQAANHPSRNIISRALGADYAVEVDLKTIMFEPDTTFLLCSDGITRHIGDEEIRELLASGDAPAEIAQRMKQICYERGAEDNLTAVIAKISGAAIGNFVAAKSETVKNETVKNETVHDYEEPTVATARATGAFAADTVPLEKSAAKNLSAADDAAPTGEIISNSTVVQSHTVPLVAETSAPTAGQMIAGNERKGASPIVENKREKIIETEVESTRAGETEDSGSGGKLGKILSALLWIIVGAMAGAGLYHLFLQNNKPPETPVIAQQSEDVNLTAFEKKRREADRNPQQYLAANASATPDNAEDFYLLGRADLFGGKFAEAKQMFAQAKERLAQNNEAYNKVLANDIETGLIIAGVPQAQEEFKKAMRLNQTGAPETDQNSDANQTTNNR